MNLSRQKRLLATKTMSELDAYDTSTLASLNSNMKDAQEDFLQAFDMEVKRLFVPYSTYLRSDQKLRIVTEDSCEALRELAEEYGLTYTHVHADTQYHFHRVSL